jgi:hypothetical protein
MAHQTKSLIGILALALFAGLIVPVFADEIQGRIVSVRPEKNEITVSETFKPMTFQVAKDAVIFINGRTATLAELRPGDDARVIFLRDDERLTAREVRAIRKKL